jgi:hypothetical protein
MGQQLLVADLTENLTLLDLQAGKSKGPGWSLSASAVPAVAPAAWTKGRVLAPLTDGTIVLMKTE